MDSYVDPMDYTMDNPQQGQQSDSPHRYQCQQPPPPPPYGMSLGGPGREGNRYDPVHESSGWYQNNSNANPSRPVYSPGSHFQPQWGANSAAHHTWYPYSETPQPGPPQSEFSSYVASRNYMNMSWPESRSRAGLDPASFGYGSQVPPMPGNGTQEANPPGGLLPPSSGPLSANPPPPQPQYQRQQAALRHQQTALTRAQQQLHLRQILANGPPAPFEPARTQEEIASRSHGMQMLIEHRIAASGMSRNNTYSHPAPPSSSLPPARRRGNRTTDGNTGPNFAWSDSDEEDDLSPASSNYEMYRRAQLFLSGEIGDERTIAMLRGQLAAKTKRVPSKEAIKALEKVDIKTLEGDDLTCSICYNELGVENPEGLVETPIRLPKCKHLFGNLCIKKWFEDNDTCPYCRDKLPSEVSIRKAAGFEMFQQRQRYLTTVRTQRGNLAPRFGSQAEEPGSSSRPPVASSQPNQDENEYTPFRSGSDSWGYSPTRASGGESPEYRLRARARGRVGSTRASGHTSGRPTSVGSSRWMNASSSNPDPFAQRTQFPTPMDQNWSSNAPVRSVTPGLNTQASPTGPPNSHVADGVPTRPQFGHSDSAPTIEASPPVAVGSGIPPRAGQSDFWFEAAAWRDTRDLASNSTESPPDTTAASGSTQRPSATLPLSQLLSNAPQAQSHNENANQHNNSNTQDSTARWSR